MELKMAHSIAWRFFRQNPDIEYDDLLSEALVAYCEARNRFDPEKGAKETTLAYTYMVRAVQNYVTKEQEISWNVPLESTPEIAAPLSVPLFEILQEMGTDAQEICRMVLSAPEEYAGFLPKVNRGQIYRELRKRGWAWSKIWRTFNEIKQVLNKN